MRRFFQILLLTLVLLTVSLISALTAMQFAIHGREVSVPGVIGKTTAEAERAASASGLRLAVERQFFSADISEGKIMTQLPPAGTKVRRGWTIRAAQSLGPQRVTIPDLTNASERAAELNIRRRGLVAGYVAWVNLPDALQDKVVSQSPPANASGVSAPKIDLLVSLGPEAAAYVMPTFSGQPLANATIALQDAGIHVGKVSVISAATPGEPQPASAASSQPSAASVIVNQVPAPGEKIASGSLVNFEVR
ncbi:MAG: PASTA domain-containing protein [Terriglobales bacterium]